MYREMRIEKGYPNNNCQFNIRMGNYREAEILVKVGKLIWTKNFRHLYLKRVIFGWNTRTQINLQESKSKMMRAFGRLSAQT